MIKLANLFSNILGGANLSSSSQTDSIGTEKRVVAQRHAFLSVFLDMVAQYASARALTETTTSLSSNASSGSARDAETYSNDLSTNSEISSLAEHGGSAGAPLPHEMTLSVANCPVETIIARHHLTSRADVTASTPIASSVGPLAFAPPEEHSAGRINMLSPAPAPVISQGGFSPTAKGGGEEPDEFLTPGDGMAKQAPLPKESGQLRTNLYGQSIGMMINGEDEPLLQTNSGNDDSTQFDSQRTSRSDAAGSSSPLNPSSPKEMSVPRANGVRVILPTLEETFTAGSTGDVKSKASIPSELSGVENERMLADQPQVNAEKDVSPDVLKGTKSESGELAATEVSSIANGRVHERRVASSSLQAPEKAATDAQRSSLKFPPTIGQVEKTAGEGSRPEAKFTASEKASRVQAENIRRVDVPHRPVESGNDRATATSGTVAAHEADRISTPIRVASRATLSGSPPEELQRSSDAINNAPFSNDGVKEARGEKEQNNFSATSDRQYDGPSQDPGSGSRPRFEGSPQAAPRMDHEGDQRRTVASTVSPSTGTAAQGAISPKAFTPSEKPAILHETARAIVETIARDVRLTVGDTTSEMRVVLKPESLGALILNVRLVEGKLTAHIDATNPAVRAALEANVPQLQAALAGQGLELDRVVVAQATQSPFGDSRSQQETKPRQPSRKRFEEEALEEYQLVRDMGYNTMEITI